METTHESFPDNGMPEAPMAAIARTTPSRLSLPAKGSCWYCEKPLDSVRRFCGKSCADSFDEEAEYTR
ncbi:hypothetical protein [Massilia niastensis]|uniref:hypothetical protein n=1 Tax=Massilia niastensis TaxID=544911 RepID=UPI000594A235|nr:hypothetical protein [Massilia niastensis]